MNKLAKYSFSGALLIAGTFWFNSGAAFFAGNNDDMIDSLLADTLANVKAEGPQFKLKSDPSYPSGDLKTADGVQLKNPSNIKSGVEFDPVTNQYVFTNKIGNFDYRRSSAMSMKEYQDYENKRTIREYWQNQASGGRTTDQRGYKPFKFGGEAFDKIFGNNTISIVPQGQAELIFKVNINSTDNPMVSERLRTVPSFDFQEKIQMNVTGTIGDRLKLGINYNTDATFDFENKTKLEYTGDEDEIVKKVEAGDVTLPLPGSLITGSQSLFGIKTDMQFGKLFVTTVLSQQKGQTQVIQTQGGSQITDFEIAADEYDANKHFFLSHDFERNFDAAHATLPSIASDVSITRVEIWTTNRKGNNENFRSIVGFIDLAETQQENLTDKNVTIYSTQGYAKNNANNLYAKAIQVTKNLKTRTGALDEAGFTAGKDYEKLSNARKLTENEYTLDRNLGYISLNSSLNADEILAVAYEYRVKNSRKNIDTVYQVGQFEMDVADIYQPLVLKLIKGTSLSPSSKTWGLMMKNIYSLGAYDVSNNDFYLNVLYHDDNKGTDIAYLPENIASKNLTLLSLFDFDNINTQGLPEPDGVFDFLDGTTIDKKYGRIIFPMLKPFGTDLNDKLKAAGVDTMRRKKYIFDELYSKTLTQAKLLAEKNKFKLKGNYKSTSSSEIYLNASNIPQGSVSVTCGGVQLTEGIDYIVDYAMGTVKVINQGYKNSGQPIKVSLENNSMFNVQTKTLVGTHLDYRFNDNFNIGGTFMHLNERPLTKKVSIGDEPISNSIWGLNSTFRTNSQFLTSMIDKLPLLQTKEVSNITLTGEFAQLIPGSSKAIGKNGVAYIDDFEGSETPYNYTYVTGWRMASVPKGGSVRLDSGATLSNPLSSGYKRAKLSWYSIDNVLQINDVRTPDPLKPDKMRSGFYIHPFYEEDLFPKKEAQYGEGKYLYLMNLTYYPYLKGPYNFDTNVDQNGNLVNPSERWGGIMQQVTTPDFEAANIEYLEFWLLDPFLEDSAKTNEGGDLYFNLGNVSEDVLMDGKMAFEQGLPASAKDTNITESSPWGRVASSLKAPLNNAFGATDEARARQDVGLDGLSDTSEARFYSSYIQTLKSKMNDQSFSAIKDWSNDDFHYFKGNDYDEENRGIIDRYMDYNGMEKNSQGAGNNDESRSSYTSPDVEDFNEDNTMSENESYYEYKIKITPRDLAVGQNYITDIRDRTVTFADKNKGRARWYQFKIPIINGKPVGDISDFKSIRFMRLFLTGFSKKTTLRIANLELVRGEWRKYLGSLVQGGESTSDQSLATNFDIQSVNLEENSDRYPVNYMLPPGIDRVIDPSQEQMRQENEQSMVLKVSDLSDGDARAAFKPASIDMRQYKKLKMFSHCEQISNEDLNDKELNLFIRIGNDYKENYYEYEIPLKVTKAGAKKPEDVWPKENNFDINLEVLQRLKQKRNDLGVPMQNVFQDYDSENKMSVRGNPTLSNIKAIMIGVRNPKDGTTGAGSSKSAEIWINELRLTDFSDKGGWAANGRAQIKLADFGNIRLSGSTMQPGFGSIEKKVNDREKVETNTFDVAADFELGKFFPEKAQVRIPMFTSYSNTTINPQFNPYDPDIPLKAAIENAKKIGANTDSLDDIRKRAQDFTQRRSLNFTNVKVNKTGKKPHFYDPANFSVSYAYDDLYSHTPLIESNWNKHYGGGISYLYNVKPKNITPFRKITLFNNKAFALFRDFNFYFLPTTVAVRTNMDKDYKSVKLRDVSNQGFSLPATIERNFLWDRNYDIKYDLSRAIKVDFSATSINRIDETEQGGIGAPEIKKAIWPQIKKGGTPVNYNHTITINYSVPINKVPLLDWTSLNLRYTGKYSWQYKPPYKGENDSLIYSGNDISNSQGKTISINANLSTIYRKIPFIKDLDTKKNPKDKPQKTVTFSKDFPSLKAGIPKGVTHKLGSEDITVVVADEKGKIVKGKVDIKSGSRVTFTPDSDAVKVTITVTAKVDAGQNPFDFLFRGMGQLATSVKSVSGSYSLTQGTSLPGYYTGKSREIEYFGSTTSNGKILPGIPFILGMQNDYIIDNLHANGALNTDRNFNSPVLMNKNENTTFRVDIQPIPALRIDLTANYSQSRNKELFYTNVLDILEKDPFPIKTGNFSMTIMSFSTFEKLSDDYASVYYKKFSDNRYLVRERLNNRDNVDLNDPRLHGDTTGFSIYSQQVLIPAFLSAYGNYPVKDVPLKLIPEIKFIRPNWRISYDGLTNIPIVADYFRSITLNHAYSSTFNIGSYQSTTNYSKGKLDANNVFQPEYDARGGVSITEQFSPYFGVDMTWKNNLTSRFEYKKSRSLSLNFSNFDITETRGMEYVIGMGYRFEEVPLKFIPSSGGSSYVKSDLNVRGDFSVREDYAILRNLNQSPQATSGILNTTITLNADYALSDKLTVNLFFKRFLNDPKVLDNNYRTTNTDFGFSVRFTLAQ